MLNIKKFFVLLIVWVCALLPVWIVLPAYYLHHPNIFQVWQGIALASFGVVFLCVIQLVFIGVAGFITLIIMSMEK